MTETFRPRGGQIARFGQRHPVIVDSLIAMSWLLLTSPFVLVADGTRLPDTATTIVFVIAVVIVAVGLVLLRRRRPTVLFVVAVAATLPLIVVDPVLSNLAAGYAVFAIAVYESSTRAWIAAAISASVTVAVCAAHLLFGLPTWDDGGDSRLSTASSVAVLGILVLLVAVSFGQIAGGRRRYILDLIAHAEQIERDRDQQVQFATLEERARIARDMHDIVAHSISVVVRLADGAQAVLPDDPQRARRALEQIGETGRSSLNEIRRVIGMLDTAPGVDHEQSGTALDDLERLVDVYRGVGLPVTLVIDGELPPHTGLQTTLYRVTQEALTNALRHSTSPTMVSVSIAAGDGVSLAIRNDGVLNAATNDQHVGHGLIGMRQRTDLYRGTFTAGPDGDGHWLVTMTLPAETR